MNSNLNFDILCVHHEKMSAVCILKSGWSVSLVCWLYINQSTQWCISTNITVITAINQALRLHHDTSCPCIITPCMAHHPYDAGSIVCIAMHRRVQISAHHYLEMMSSRIMWNNFYSSMIHTYIAVLLLCVSITLPKLSLFQRHACSLLCYTSSSSSKEWCDKYCSKLGYMWVTMPKQLYVAMIQGLMPLSASQMKEQCLQRTQATQWQWLYWFR